MRRVVHLQVQLSCIEIQIVSREPPTLIADDDQEIVERLAIRLDREPLGATKISHAGIASLFAEGLDAAETSSPVGEDEGHALQVPVSDLGAEVDFQTNGTTRGRFQEKPTSDQEIRLEEEGLSERGRNKSPGS